MPTDDPVKQYWDSCMFIAYLQNESSRVPVIQDLIRRAKNGRIQIIISNLVLAEVRPYADQYNADHFKIVEDLLQTNRPYLRPVALTGAIARRARQIGEQHRTLSVADAIHIATAEQENVSVLFTYDGVRSQGMRRSRQMTDFNRKFGNSALEIREPFVDHGPLFEATQDQEEKPEGGTTESG